jgi:hypothetical protein
MVGSIADVLIDKVDEETVEVHAVRRRARIIA